MRHQQLRGRCCVDAKKHVSDIALDRHERLSPSQPVATLLEKTTPTSTEEVVMRAPMTDIILLRSKNRLRLSDI
jgi:hypothetical protein